MTTFSKTHRLLAKPQFDAVLNDGVKVVCRDFVLVASSKDTGLERCRLGLIVSGKVGNSVQRNRVKRCVREVFKAGVPDSVHGRDLVVIARHSLATKDKKIVRDIHASFGKCLNRLGKVLSDVRS